MCNGCHSIHIRGDDSWSGGLRRDWGTSNRELWQSPPRTATLSIVQAESNNIICNTCLLCYVSIKFLII